MNGLVLGDEKIIRMMDETLKWGSSSIISAGINKDGTLRKNSKAVSKEELRLLINHVRKLYKKAGDRIVSGDVEIAPYQLNDRTACTFCPFKAVCQFDATLGGNQYRILSASKNEVINLIRKEGVTDGDEEDSRQA